MLWLSLYRHSRTDDAMHTCEIELPDCPAHTNVAVELVCEYLSSSWSDKVAEAFQKKEVSVQFHPLNYSDQTFFKVCFPTPEIESKTQVLTDHSVFSELTRRLLFVTEGNGHRDYRFGQAKCVGTVRRR